MKTKEEKAAYTKKYRAENRERLKARDKEYRAENREKEKARRAKYRSENHDKERGYQTKYRVANREKMRVAYRKRTHGLSDFDYNRMSDEAGFSCEICKGGLDDPTTRKRATLHIDHCHRTNKVRGLLCHECNTGLGKFKDSLGLLRAAAQYLLDRG